ncbi:MAG: hypothetical protein M3Z80_04350 [Apibacter sp.]|nr:hypothetical protein [Apibacter sp.]MCT6869158.1 hypothetical protein [Apibacter sp.]
MQELVSYISDRYFNNVTASFVAIIGDDIIGYFISYPVINKSMDIIY